MTRDDAIKILDNLKNSPNMVKHGLAVGYTMAELYDYFAKKNGKPELSKKDWGVVGILHVACALVRPDKKLKSVTVESVLKKFKEKSFAAEANRDQIKTCEKEPGIPLEEFVSITLKEMQNNASKLGL